MRSVEKYVSDLVPWQYDAGFVLLSNIWRELNGALSPDKCSNKVHLKSRDEGTRHVLTPGIQPKTACADIRLLWYLAGQVGHPLCASSKIFIGFCFWPQMLLTSDHAFWE